MPEEYPYSSARTHFGLEKSDILCDDFFYESQRNDYIMFIRGEIEEDQLKDIRSSLKTGGPLSSNKCLKDIEEKLARKLGAQPIGRPRKKIH